MANRPAPAGTAGAAPKGVARPSRGVSGSGGKGDNFLLNALLCMRGHVVKAKLKDGTVWEGVFVNITKNDGMMGIVLQEARKWAKWRTPYVDRKTIEGKDLLVMYVSHIELENKGNRAEVAGKPRGFATDTEISGGVKGGERQLQQWRPDPQEKELIGSLEELGSKGGSTRGWDQFATNERITKKKSTFKFDDYSTELDKNSELYKKNIAWAREQAARIGKKEVTNVQEAIERGHDVNMDEEDMFSKVLDDPEAAGNDGGVSGSGQDDNGKSPTSTSKPKEEPAVSTSTAEEKSDTEKAKKGTEEKKEKKKKKKKKSKFSKAAKEFVMSPNITPSPSPPPVLQSQVGAQYPYQQANMQPLFVQQPHLPPGQMRFTHPGAVPMPQAQHGVPMQPMVFGGQLLQQQTHGAPPGARLMNPRQPPQGGRMQQQPRGPYAAAPQPTGFENLYTPAQVRQLQQQQAQHQGLHMMTPHGHFASGAPQPVSVSPLPQQHQHPSARRGSHPGRRGSNPPPPQLQGQRHSQPGPPRGQAGPPGANGQAPQRRNSQTHGHGGNAPLLPTPDATGPNSGPPQGNQR